MAGFIQAANEMTLEGMVDLLLLIQIFNDSRTNDHGSLFYEALKKKKTTEQPFGSHYTSLHWVIGVSFIRFLPIYVSDSCQLQL